MSANLAALLYLVAGVLFILALRGLSRPDTSRRGNYLGMIGMTIAVLTTLGAHPPAEPARLGAGDRRHRARRRHRRGDRAARADDLDAGTGRRLPLAGRHGGGAGRGRRVLRAGGLRHRQRTAISTAPSLIEMSLGVAIGAITFTGSVIAFLKLSGRMSGTPIMLPGRHVINIALAARADLLHLRLLRLAERARFLADRRRSRSRSAC